MLLVRHCEESRVQRESNLNVLGTDPYRISRDCFATLGTASPKTMASKGCKGSTKGVMKIVHGIAEE